MNSLQAPVDKDRKFLGIFVRGCTVKRGRIVNVSGASPFHLTNVAELVDVPTTVAESYHAARKAQVDAAMKIREKQGDDPESADKAPIHAPPVKYLNRAADGFVGLHEYEG